MKKRIFILFTALIFLAGSCLNDTGKDIPGIQPAGVRAIDTVDTGTGPNTGTGDPLRTAFEKINDAINILNDVEIENVTSPIQTQLNARSRTASVTANLTAGVEADVTLTGVTSEPYAIWILDENGVNITEAVKDSTAISFGTYHTYIYSVDSKSNIKVKVLW